MDGGKRKTWENQLTPSWAQYDPRIIYRGFILSLHFQLSPQGTSLCQSKGQIPFFNDNEIPGNNTFFYLHDCLNNLSDISPFITMPKIHKWSKTPVYKIGIIITLIELTLKENTLKIVLHE